MKTVAFFIDLIVLGGLVAVLIFAVGDSYSHGSIVTKALYMGGVGAVYGLLRSGYRKWLLPDEDKN